jgi:transposase
MSKERGYVVFQQDKAPSHHAKSTITWLSRNLIKTFPHPPSSPDLSPIEPLWKTLKTLIRSRSHIPSNIEELKAVVCEAWEQITEHDINCHVKHMEEKVQAVLEAKGGHTKW